MVTEKGERAMAEYIEREALIKAIENDCLELVYYTKEDAIQCVKAIPAADVAPVVHGRLEYIPQTINTLSRLRCSVCGWWTLDPSVDDAYNYCPRCGARWETQNDYLQKSVGIV